MIVAVTSATKARRIIPEPARAHRVVRTPCWRKLPQRVDGVGYQQRSEHIILDLRLITILALIWRTRNLQFI